MKAGPSYNLLRSITLDKAQAKAAEELLRTARNALPRAMSKAANAAGRDLRTDVVKILSEHIQTKGKRIGHHVVLDRASVRNPEAVVRVKKEKMPLYALGARQNKRGVAYWIGGERREIAGAFVAQMRSTHWGVYLRGRRWPGGPEVASKPREKYSKKGIAGWPELPIFEQFGPSTTSIITRSPGLLDAALAKASQTFSDAFDAAVEAELKKVS